MLDLAAASGAIAQGLGGQVARQNERPVVVVSKADAAILSLALRARQLLGLLAAPVGTDETLDVRSGAMPGDGQQVVFIRGVADG